MHRQTKKILFSSSTTSLIMSRFHLFLGNLIDKNDNGFKLVRSF